MNKQSVKSRANNKLPLSQCDIWQQQKDFYQRESINAWAGKIPFYVTSNPYIANSYANMITRFMQDCRQRNVYQPLEPFYIIELGAGSGTFSFYTIKRLLELQQALHLTDISWVYVMTDMVENNIQFWRTQPALQQYIQRGVLDFAQYDAENDKTIQLLHSKCTLTKPATQNNISNPLIVIANYVLDTLAQDAFTIKAGQLQQAIVEKSTRIAKADYKNKGYITIDELATLDYGTIAWPLYPDKNLDAVLGYYAQHLQQGSHLLFPTGSFTGIKNLADIADNKLLLLSTDKGYAQHFELYSQHKPDLVFHDACFSMMVNFHAIGKYFQQRDGDSYHQATQQSITTSAFTLGFKFGQLPETQQALVTYIDHLSHGNLFDFYNHIHVTKYQCSLETLIAYLSTMQWDPVVFNFCFDTIINQIKSTTAPIIHDLIAGMPKIAANVYYLPNAIDTLANLGILFHELNNYPAALNYYQQSLQIAGEVDTTFYNMGLCYYFLKEYNQALAMFKKTIAMTPHYIMAKGWIVQIETELAELKKNIPKKLVINKKPKKIALKTKVTA